MPIQFPSGVDTALEKYAYCQRAFEKLNNIYSFFGIWYRQGITQNQYNNLPDKIRIKYPYKTQLTESDWHDFRVNDWDRVGYMITKSILEQRKILVNSQFYDSFIKIEDIDGDDRD